MHCELLIEQAIHGVMVYDWNKHRYNLQALKPILKH